MATLEDAVGVLQNIVIAVNSVAQKLSEIEGASSMENITATTLIKKGSGRIVRVSVTTAGSTVGFIYDAPSTILAAATNLVATIPNTVGIYEIKIPVEYGLVVTPGTSQVLSLSFS